MQNYEFPVSVIMSVYNCGSFLNPCIKSILNQTLSHFEFIIIDDGSTDNSKEILYKFQRKDLRIKLIFNEKNLGIAGARNKGIEIAKGKYIAIMDGDDLAAKCRLEKTYNFLEKNPNYFLVGTSAYIIDKNNKILSKIDVITDFEKIKQNLKHKINPFLVNSIMFRNDTITNFRKKFNYCEDYDFYLRLLTQNKRMANLADHLVYYRKNPNSVSFSKRTKMALFFRKAFEFYCERTQSGKDSYSNFNPSEILNKKLNYIEKNENSKMILNYEIVGNFQIGNLKETQNLSLIYLRNFGFLNKNLIYYLCSLNYLVYMIYNKLMKILDIFHIRNYFIRDIYLE